MQLKTGNKSYLRFLKDEKFIEWKLFPTDELDTYWEEFLQQSPGERDNILLAEKHFREINLSSHELSRDKKREAMERLEQSLRAYHRKLVIRRFAYAGAASIAVLILSLFYFQNMNRPENKFGSPENYIVGNKLASEDILFISGNKTTSFHRNVDIQIEGDRTAQVKSEGSETEAIAINERTINKIVVPYGKRSRIVLSDGTRVWLNSGSSLEFPSVFAGNSREISLTGEMYIEVTPNQKRPFYVRTNDFNVRVYGTKFNVSSYSESTSSVVLVEGSIGLQSTGSRELILSPNEQAIYSATGNFHTQVVDVRPFIAWTEGYLTFDDTPVNEALKQIERYYNLSFDFGDNVSFQGLTCTGKIILSDNLDNVMTTLSLISDTKYKREDNLIYIYKENKKE